MTIWIILVLCGFFTLITLLRPNVMWSILSAICWFLLFWWTRSNPLAGFAVGDTGDTVIISICWGAIAFVLLYTIRDSRNKKREREAKESENAPKAVGTRESADDYYDRLDRTLHPKKK